MKKQSDLIESRHLYDQKNCKEFIGSKVGWSMSSLKLAKTRYYDEFFDNAVLESVHWRDKYNMIFKVSSVDFKGEKTKAQVEFIYCEGLRILE